MKKCIRVSLAVISLPLILVQSSYACTAFTLQKENRIVFGRNYDWSISDGLVIINKKNLSKNGLLANSKNSLNWTSKYGSISFNQYGKDLPLEGMNEQGLTIASLILDTTDWEPPDSRVPINPLVWIQYQLDTSATVKEVIESSKKIRLDGKNSAPIHYLVCDKYGNAVIIEFLKGRPVYSTAKDLPIVSLTNNTYAESLIYFRADKNQRANLSKYKSGYSLERFVLAAQMVAEYKPQTDMAIEKYAFKILSSVDKGSTQWSIVYDSANLIAHFKTHQHPVIKSVKLKDFNLNCDTPSMILDINTGKKGDVSQAFIPYSTEKNKELIYSVYKKIPFLKNIPDKILENLSKWPNSHKCTAAADKKKHGTYDINKHLVFLLLFFAIIILMVYLKKKA